MLNSLEILVQKSCEARGWVSEIPHPNLIFELFTSYILCGFLRETFISHYFFFFCVIFSSRPPFSTFPWSLPLSPRPLFITTPPPPSKLSTPFLCFPGNGSYPIKYNVQYANILVYSSQTAHI